MSLVVWTPCIHCLPKVQAGQKKEAALWWWRTRWPPVSYVFFVTIAAMERSCNLCILLHVHVLEPHVFWRFFGVIKDGVTICFNDLQQSCVLLIPCFIVALTYVWIHWKLSVFGDIVLLSCYRLWLAWIFCSAEPDARHPPWISHTLLPENVRLPTAKITRYLILETLKDSGLNNLTITTCNILKPAINIPSIYLFYTWEFLFSRYEILVVQLHRSWVSSWTWWAHEGLSSPHRCPKLFMEFLGMKSYKGM